MLDDENVLNQFYVRDFLRLNQKLAQQALADFETRLKDYRKTSQEVPAASMQDSKSKKFDRLWIVAEDGARQYQALRFCLAAVKTGLTAPINLSWTCDDKYLDDKSLVLIDTSWFDQNALGFNRKRVQKSRATLIQISGWLDALFYLVVFGVLSSASVRKILQSQIKAWVWGAEQMGPSLSLAHNSAKQNALFLVGKTAVFTSNSSSQVLADVFLSRVRQIAHNLAFSEDLVEQMNGANLGWSSHPVDKPFATFVIKYKFSASEEALIKQRTRQLSGLMPASRSIEIEAEDQISALFRTEVMATYLASYLAVLNKRVLAH